MPKKAGPKAAKTTKPVEPKPKPVGRPTDFKDEYVTQVYMLGLLGATDVEIAEFFGCAESTLNLWKKEHPDFSESIKEGKEKADMKLATKLFNRAEGATINQQQAIKVKRTQYDDKGKKIAEFEEVEVVDLVQELPPDTTALIFWLKNRKSSKWRDKQEHELTGKDGAPLVPTINLTLGTQS